MIKKTALPDRTVQTGLLFQGLGRPLFPFSDKVRQCNALFSIRAEKVNMIRHDHIRANGPAVPIQGIFPFVTQHRNGFLRSKNSPTVFRTDGDEVARIDNPYPIQPLQVFMVWHGQDFNRAQRTRLQDFLCS